MPADAVMPITVVVECRASKHPWQDEIWRPLGVVPRTAGECGQVLASGEGWTHFHGGTLDIELFRGETEGYRSNLSQETPLVYVVLSRNEQSEGMAFEPFLATACPYEAEAYTDGGDEIVEGVPMRPELVEWVRQFVAQHHVDRPFVKRKNRRDKHADMGRPAQPGRAPS
ncbi:MAG: DUF3305 domain-containing protein [Pseudolabrys sp.]